MSHSPSPRAPFLLEEDRSLPLLHATIAFRPGSLDDPVGKEGVVRLLFRLLRRTAGGRSADVSEDWLDRLGAHAASDVSRSVAALQGTTIVRSEEHFLAFLRDVFERPHFAEDEFVRLKAETAAELVEGLDSDRSLVQKFWNQAMFEGHPYARTSSGTLNSLERIELRDLEETFAQLVVAERVEVAFSGNISRTRVEAFTGALRSGLPSGSPALKDPPEPLAPRGRSLLFVDKPERTQTQILIGGLGTHPHDSDHTALHVANTIFGGTFTARLSQEVRAKRGWSYGAYSQLPIDRVRQSFSLWTFPQASDAAACIELELRLLEEFLEKGATERELRAAKKYLTNSHAFSVDTASKRVSLALDERLYGLPEGYSETYLTRLGALTLEDVNQAIARRLSARDLVVCVVGTAAEIQPAVEKACGALTRSTIVPFDSRD